jgi:hypothetical protein
MDFVLTAKPSNDYPKHLEVVSVLVILIKEREIWV